MRHARLMIPTLLAGAALTIGCESPVQPGAPRDAAEGLNLDQGQHGAVAWTAGGGHYLLQNTFDVQIAFGAVKLANGKVIGNFHHKLDTGNGTFDVRGKVTCLAFDPVNNRAWIGGVVTQNRSTDPAFQQPHHQPGHDAWFRVVDYGVGQQASQPDRTTFIGFENTPGIPTSAFYCATMPWPEPDLRTWPMTNGNIHVRVDN